jgi:hypothetical protein
VKYNLPQADIGRKEAGQHTQRMTTAQLRFLCILLRQFISDAIEQLYVALLRVLLHSCNEGPGHGACGLCCYGRVGSIFPLALVLLRRIDVDEVLRLWGGRGGGQKEGHKKWGTPPWVRRPNVARSSKPIFSATRVERIVLRAFKIYIQERQKCTKSKD